MNGPSALQRGFAGCRVCELVLRVPADAGRRRLRCPRCGATVHPRKPASLTRTWALLLAAYGFYVPAMALPITRITTFGVVQEDTILSGVVYFFRNGEWPVGAVIFVASVFVPVLKLLVLTALALSVQRGWRGRPHDRTRLYRLTETIGRWSMVDIYVVTLLVALVQVGAVAGVEVGPAAFHFAAVVVLTILAADAFDPRLIWDRLEEGA